MGAEMEKVFIVQHISEFRLWPGVGEIGLCVWS